MMNQTFFRTPRRAAALAVLLAASASLFAGSTIRITNTSTQPWCLRISEEPAAPILVHGGSSSTAVELSPSHKLVYYIQPGETCTLQFRNLETLPAKKEVGLVDQAGAEKGVLRIESSAGQTLAPGPGGCINSRVQALTDVPSVVRQDADDALSIIANAWS